MSNRQGRQKKREKLIASGKLDARQQKQEGNTARIKHINAIIADLYNGNMYMEDVSPEDRAEINFKIGNSKYSFEELMALPPTNRNTPRKFSNVHTRTEKHHTEKLQAVVHSAHGRSIGKLGNVDL